MFKMLTFAGLMVAGLLIAGNAWAEGELDFSGINQGPAVALPAAAAITPPPDPSSGQGAPYHSSGSRYGYSGHEYGGWNGGYYDRYNELKRRYDNVRSRVKDVRGWYSRNTTQRQTIDAHLTYGAQLWSHYRRYQDQNSAWQLESWIAQWESYLAQVGWNQGGWNQGGWNQGGWNSDWSGTGGGWSGGYTYPEYGYYDNYDRWYYGNNAYYGNSAYTDGYLLGNSIGHIVNGSRYDNGLQLTGGILGTIGNSLNIINNSRGW